MVQQKQGRVASTLQTAEGGVNTDSQLEREADEMGAATLQKGGKANSVAKPKQLKRVSADSNGGEAVVQGKFAVQIRLKESEGMELEGGGGPGFVISQVRIAERPGK